VEKLRKRERLDMGKSFGNFAIFTNEGGEDLETRRVETRGNQKTGGTYHEKRKSAYTETLINSGDEKVFQRKEHRKRRPLRPKKSKD